MRARAEASCIDERPVVVHTVRRAGSTACGRAVREVSRVARRSWTVTCPECLEAVAAECAAAEPKPPTRREVPRRRHPAPKTRKEKRVAAARSNRLRSKAMRAHAAKHVPLKSSPVYRCALCGGLAKGGRCAEHMADVHGRHGVSEDGARLGYFTPAGRA